MRRRHLVELEDLAWFPRSFRDALTDWLQDLVVEEDLYAPASEVIADVLTGLPDRRIIDTCSGGGGPWLTLKSRVEQLAGPVELLLTDKHPNVEGLTALAERIGDGRTGACPEPVDLTGEPIDPAALVTCFSAFHHFPPPVAREVLVQAARHRQPIAVFDVADRSQVLNALRHVPPGAFRSLQRRRPRSAAVTACTYLPVLPAAITWDALVSNLRAYEPEDLTALLADVPSDGWKWEVGRLTGPTGGRVTYLTGRPLP
jgi:hypothetical protein